MAGAAEEAFADGVECDGGGEQHGDEGEGERVAANVFEAVKNLDAGDLRVVEDEGRAEFREGPDEDDGAAGEEAGHNERQRDFPKTAEAGAAEILGGFLHRGVNVGEGGDGVEVNDGVEREGLDDGDAPELVCRKPVDRGTGSEQAELAEQGIEGAVLSEHLFNADGADEGRQDHRDEDEGAEETF